MADDERHSEIFIREVDEEIRREQLKQLWSRFAPLIIGVCVLVVVLTAGYRGWLWWTERQAAQAGDRFAAAVTLIEDGKTGEGEAALQAIVADGGGYAALAGLRLAGEKAKAGDKAGALAAFDAVAANTSVSQPLRELAEARSALIALDMGDLDGARSRAAPLDVAGNPWRHVAREVLGTAAYQSGDLAKARDIYAGIQEDAETPPDLWIRSGLMISLINGQLAEPAADEAGSDASPAPEQGDTGANPAAPPEPAPAAEADPASAGSGGNP